MRDLHEIATMAELRQEIDAFDRLLVAQLARRTAMIDRAVMLKQRESMPARIDARVEAVVANVRTEAERLGWDPALAERMWRAMIEWSIAREERVLGGSTGGAPAS